MKKRSECVSVLVVGGWVVPVGWCVCSTSCARCPWCCVEGAGGQVACAEDRMIVDTVRVQLHDRVIDSRQLLDLLDGGV